MKLRNFKTGEICDAEAREDGIYIKASWSDDGDWFRYGLGALASGWDYYVEPKEPLIKSKALRNVIKEWAKGNKVTEVTYDSFWRGLRIPKGVITIWEDCDLEDSKTYTIEELCRGDDGQSK